MPYRDGTGPRGLGAGTGRGLGHCQAPGWTCRKAQRVWQVDDKTFLQKQLQALEEEKKDIEQRLKKLE